MTTHPSDLTGQASGPISDLVAIATASLDAPSSSPARLLARQAAALAETAIVLLRREHQLVVTAVEPAGERPPGAMLLDPALTPCPAPVQAVLESAIIISPGQAIAGWPALAQPHVALPLAVHGEISGVLVVIGDATRTASCLARLTDLAALGAHALGLDHLSIVIKAIPDLVIVIDDQLNLVALNDSLFHLFDYVQATESPRVISDLARYVKLAKVDGQPVDDDDLAIVQALRQERAVTGEYTVQTPGGRQLMLDSHAAPLRDASGRVIGAVSITRDVSESRRQATHLAAIADAAQRVVGSLDLTVVLRQAIEQVVGLLQADAASLWLLQANGVDLVVADRYNTPTTPLAVDRLTIDAPSLTAYAARTRTTQVVEEVSALDQQFTLTHQVLGHDAGIQSLACLPLIVRDQLVGVLTAMSRRPHHFQESDLRTVRALANQVAIAIENARLFGRVESQERWLRTIISGLPDGIVVTGAPEGRVIATNPAADRLLGPLLEAPPAPLVTELAFRLPDSLSGRAADIPIFTTIKNGTPCEATEILYDHPSGVTRVLLANSALLRGRDDEPRFAIMAFQDITALKAEQRRRDEFLSIVSHELKTPLTNIRGYSDLIRRRLDRHDQTMPYQRELTIISHQVERMTRLVNDLLDLSRLETGHFPVHLARVNLAEIVTRAVDSLRITEAAHQITLHGPSPTAIICGDSSRLEQVINNLLHNALRYSPDGSPIEVHLGVTLAEATVTVRDHGPGIPADQQPYLFQRYYRAPDAPGSGLGLGLFISQEIVSRHQGRLTVDSTVGQGSIFRLTLPLDGRLPDETRRPPER